MTPRSFFRFFLSVAAFACFALLPVGCGDDNGTDPDENDGPSEEQLDELDDVSTQHGGYASQLDGLIAHSTVEQAKDSLVALLSAQTGAVDAAGKSSQGVWVRYALADGGTVGGGFIVDPEFYDSADAASGAPDGDIVPPHGKTADHPGNVNTLYLAPVYTEMQSVVPGVVDDVLGEVNPALHAAGYQSFTLVKDGNCKVDRFANLSGYGIVRIHAHGNPWPSNTNVQHVYIPTGEERTRATDEKYYDDLIGGDIAWTVRNGKTYYYVSSDFVADQNDFGSNHTFLSLGFCYSDLGGWPGMVSTSGAVACTGHDGIVSGQQERDWAIEFFASMCDTTPGEPMTIADWFATHTTTATGGNGEVNLVRHGAGSTTLWANGEVDLTAADSVVALANAKLEDILFDEINEEEDVVRPSDIDFTEVRNLYEQALAFDPDHPTANFGAAVTGLLSLTVDTEVNDAFDAWDDYLAENVPFEVESSAKRPLGIPISMGGGKDAFALPFDVVPYTILADTKQGLRIADPDLVDVQDLLEFTVLPEVEDAIGKLDRTLAEPGYTYNVTPRMQGDVEEEAAEIDRTDIFALRAACNLLSSAIRVAVSYEVSFTAYDSLSLHQAIQPGSDWLTLRSGGASHMATAYQRIEAAVDDVDSAIVSLRGEGDNQDDDVIKIGPNDVDQADLDSIETNLDNVRDLLGAGTRRTEDWDGNDSTPEEDLFISLDDFFNDPVDDLKALLPEYTTELRRAPWNREDVFTYEGVMLEVTVPEAGDYSANYKRSIQNFFEDSYTSNDGPGFLADGMEAYITGRVDDITHRDEWAGDYWGYMDYFGYLPAGTQQIQVTIDERYNTAERWVLHPVVIWDADTFDEWTWPDPTVGGLFPELHTSDDLVTIFGGNEGNWEKETRIDWSQGGWGDWEGWANLWNDDATGPVDPGGDGGDGGRGR